MTRPDPAESHPDPPLLQLVGLTLLLAGGVLVLMLLVTWSV